MAAKTSTLTVKLVDQVSGPASAASAALARIGIAAQGVNARGMAGGLAGALQNIAHRAEAAQRRLRALANETQSLRTGILIGGGFLARDLIEFDRLGNKLEAFGKATKKQREDLEAYAHALDAMFGAFKFTDVLGGFSEMMKQGLKVPQIIGGAGRSILAFAQASGITPDEASKYLLTGVTAAGLPQGTPAELQKSLDRFADIQSYVADATHLDARTAADAARFAAPAGAAVGMTPEQMGALTIAMAKAGFQGSEIGVAERSMIVSLIRGGKKQQEAFARLGINRGEFVTGGTGPTAEGIVSTLGVSGISAGSAKGTIAALLADKALSSPELIAKITDALVAKGAGDDRTAIAEAVGNAITQNSGMKIDVLGLLQRIREKGGDAELVNIFEGRQFPKMQSLLRAEIRSILTELNTAVGSGGVTAEKARKMAQGLSGAWDAFVANIQKLEDAIGKSGINTLLENLLNGLSAIVSKLADTNPTVLFAGTIAALGVTTIGVAAKVAALTVAISRLGAASLAGTAGAAAGTGVGTAAAAGAGAGVAARVMGKLGLAGAVLLGLDATDQKGDLFGLTSGIDRWMGWDPKNISAPKTIGDLEREMAAFRERLAIERNAGGAAAPFVPAAPTLSTATPTADFSPVAGKAGEAGTDAAQSFASNFEALASARLRAWAASLNLNVSVTPRVDLGGLHGDVGVSPTR